MINVPLTVIIALLTVMIGAWLQRRHWLRSTYEEIRVRETTDAGKLASEIARVFDQRLTAQRSYLAKRFTDEEEISKLEYKKAVAEYSRSFNDIRFRIFYYLSYKDVVKFEEDLHERIVSNSAKIGNASSKRQHKRVSPGLDSDLSIISAQVFRFCRNLTESIAREDIGSLPRLRDWKDPANDYVSAFYLLRRLLNA